jgi:predicted Fe-S protein YdhL (DUF1289 family)
MNIRGEKDLTDSPCIGICSTTYGDDFCMGCGRSFDEVNNWNKMNDAEKIVINQRLQTIKNNKAG